MKAKVRSLAAEYSLKALAASPLRDGGAGYGTDRLKLEKGFMDGIEALMASIESEAERITGSVEASRHHLTDHERGVLEGVRWLREAVLGGFDVD